MTLPLEPLEHLEHGGDEPRVVTIGTFDGVHRGHQELIRVASDQAQQAGVTLTVISFDPPPMAVLRPDRFLGRIVTAARKRELLLAAGAADVVVLPFTPALAAVTAEAFMEALSVRANVKMLLVGEGFALGHNRAGTVEVLTDLGTSLGIEVRAIPRVELNGNVVSSSAIRRAILDGRVDIASSMLGRYFRIEGDVIHGAQVGRTIGFPTANVMPPEGQVQLADGIYASLAHLPDTSAPLPAMTYIGTRPALNTGRRQIETHILDFDGDLYGQLIAVEFVERLRADSDFPGVDALVAQLHRDEAETRTVLAALGVQVTV